MIKAFGGVPLTILSTVLSLIFLSSCSTNSSTSFSDPEQSFADDPHSFSEPWHIVTDSLHLDLEVDFQDSIVQGRAIHFIDVKSERDTFVLDINKLSIEKVTVDGEQVAFQISEPIPFMGSALSIPVNKDAVQVEVHYKTSPEAVAFLWVSAAQTKDKIAPFLFTQGQAILTRSWIPCQDSPGIRFPYSASIRVPEGLMALMSANNPIELSEDGMYNFHMKTPVPAYLIALAVGKLEYIRISDRTGVYCEPSLVDACKYEFAEMEAMVEAAEDLYGPYRWEQFDIIILPPSFPFGGMENPRLTFATPTIIAGDRSLTSLIAHELAHSWSGNLVTNETWDDFWLNEGFTTYFERRIMEEVYGEDYAEMLAQLGYQDLLNDFEQLGEASNDTKLKLNLSGKDPDEGMTNVAYEKGALLLTHIEQAVGRDTFDQFLKQYFDTFAFQTMNTDKFLKYLDEQLPQASVSVPVREYIFETGLPASAPTFSAKRFDIVNESIDAFNNEGAIPGFEITGNWSTHEWLHFLRKIDVKKRSNDLKRLGEKYQLNSSNNSEIVAIWLEQSIEAGSTDQVTQKLETFLIEVGRRKFLMPIYRALINSGQRDLAVRIFTKAKSGYHSVSYNSVQQLIESTY